MTEPAPSHPGVHFPPPLLFALGALAGWLLHRALPLPLVTPRARPAGALVGWLLVALWAGWSAWAVATFLRARTAIIPNRPASALVTHGPYRLSRNPMYLGLTLLYLGVTLLVNSVWPILFLPLVLVTLHLTVILREERYLASAFGTAYHEYRRRVRRWL